MDPGFRSPLVDFFRRGDVARDVRLQAAQGAMAPRAHEQLALLVLLSDDPDQEVRETANKTLDALPAEPLKGFLARSDVPVEMRSFFETRGIVAGGSAADAAEPLVEGPGEADAIPETADPTVLANLPVKDKVKIAIKGTREQRAQLIRDPNRLVSTAVLSSPKLSDSEIEAFTKMGNVSEDTLRVIGMNRGWLKRYGVVMGLVKNPKTPLAISMQLMQRLSEKDVKMLTVDRNIPEVLRLAARKAMIKTLR